jgi:hypothetical protein
LGLPPHQLLLPLAFLALLAAFMVRSDVPSLALKLLKQVPHLAEQLVCVPH